MTDKIALPEMDLKIFSQSPEPIVIIGPTGEVTLGEGVTLSEASEAFYESVRETWGAFEALRAQRDEAVAALRKYGQHHAFCPDRIELGCDCGFTAALARLDSLRAEGDR